MGLIFLTETPAQAGLAADALVRAAVLSGFVEKRLLLQDVLSVAAIKKEAIKGLRFVMAGQRVSGCWRGVGKVVIGAGQMGCVNSCACASVNFRL